jgi:purine-nucleoside/S-methyl-5'-thioadenosine phosphorylase / adenosine deaminase
LHQHYTHYNNFVARRTTQTTPRNSRAKRSQLRNVSRPPVDPWNLRRSDGLQILELRPFKELRWLVHGFSTRSGGDSELRTSRDGRDAREKVLNLGFTDWDSRKNVEHNRLRYLHAVANDDFSLITIRQIHSDIVHTVHAASHEELGGDALVTNSRGSLLAIQTADCIPILLVDTKHRVIANVHAGWRGTLSRIASKAVGKMRMEFGTRPQDLLAALGPGIGQCCYEVGPDVVKEFAAQFPQARDWFEGPFDTLASGEDPSPLPWLSMMPPGHEPPAPPCRLDLHAANSAILADAGVTKGNIFASEFCTACRTDLFFSYRREGRTGRMMSVIGIV